MKLQQFYLLSFLTLILSFSSITLNAAHYEKPIEKTANFKLKKGNKKSLKAFFKQTFSKKSNQDKSISNIAKAALILGILSLVCLILPLLNGFFWIWLIGAVFATMGDILGIRVLRKIKKLDNEEAYQREKKIAKIGLALSILAGVVPLILLLLVIIST